ncbi:hypothetical protein, partial [Escherichia coli]
EAPVVPGMNSTSQQPHKTSESSQNLSRTRSRHNSPDRPKKSNGKDEAENNHWTDFFNRIGPKRTLGERLKRAKSGRSP